MVREDTVFSSMVERNQKQNEVRQLVEHAVAQAFQAQIPQLQSQIVQEVLQSIPAPVASSAPPADNASTLVHADLTPARALRDRR